MGPEECLCGKGFYLGKCRSRGRLCGTGISRAWSDVVVWFLCIPLPPVMVAQDMNQWTTQLSRWKSSDKKLGIVCSDFASVDFYLLSLHTTLSPTAPLKRSLSQYRLIS